ncbi:dihydrofolate reductase [Persicitalea sp.]|uniref:dihydrofolate reductase n=1 Tax=Persicitalea sp. TaxID=3100273 RepID=UPI00359374B6
MDISLIVAAAENGVIGRDNRLLWRLSDDLKRFKRLTIGHPIIMGRKTYDSIGKPLPGRTSIVITRSQDFSAEGVLVGHSLEEAIEEAKTLGAEEIFIIGGGEIYKEALARKLANKIYLTRVQTKIDGDTYFIIPNLFDWEIIENDLHPADERHDYPFQFVDLTLKTAP